MLTEPFSYRAQPAKNVTGLQFTHDSALIVANDPELCAWRVPSLEPAYRVRPVLLGIDRVLVQSHCARIVCYGGRRGLAVVDSDTGETLASYTDRSERPDALSRCGRFGIYILRHGWCVRDIETNQLTWERELPRTIVRAVTPIDDGHRWAFHIHALPGSDESSTQSRVEIWSWPFGSQPDRIVGDSLISIDDVSVHRDGGILIRGVPQPGRRTLRVYGAGNEPLAEHEAKLITRLAGWIDANHFATALDDTIEICDAMTAEVVSTLEAPGHDRYAVGVSPGGVDLALRYPQGFVHVRGDLSHLGLLRVENPWLDHRERRWAPGSVDARYRRPTLSATRTIMASTMAELTSELAELARPVWTPVLHIDEGGITASKFGGTPYVAAGTEWPRCESCQDLLQSALQLNSGDLPPTLQGLFVGLLQVFFCTTPSCAAWDPFARSAVARLTSLGEPPAFTQPPFREAFIGRGIVGWEQHLDYPNEAELDELGYQLANGPEIDGELLFPLDRDKLMGWPAWPHSPSYARCPKCSGPMRVIMQIGAEQQCTPFMFGDGYPAFISQCEQHRSVLTFHFGT